MIAVPLTPRESEIAKLVSDGLTYAKIADTLGCSPNTVNAHVTHIAIKIRVARGDCDHIPARRVIERYAPSN